MEQKLKDRLAKVIHGAIGRSIKRGPAIDPIDLAESILDSIEVPIDMFYEDAGIGTVHASDLQQAIAPAWDIHANQPAAAEDERPHFLSPPAATRAVVPAAPKDSRLLVMPGDPDFKEPDNPRGVVRPGEARASMKKGSLLRRPNKKGPAIPFWDEGELIQTVIDGSPKSISFEIKRINGQLFPVTVHQNVKNIPGVGVALTYAHPAGGEVIPEAKHVFSIFDEAADLDAALKDIAVQLQGIYVDRSGGAPDPVAVGPEPNLSDYMRSGIPGGSVRIDIERGADGRAVNISSQAPGAPKHMDTIYQQVMGSTRRDNQRLVPKESPLK